MPECHFSKRLGYIKIFIRNSGMLCIFYILLKQGVLFALDAYVICLRFHRVLLVCVAIHCILMCDCLFCPCVCLLNNAWELSN